MKHPYTVAQVEADRARLATPRVERAKSATTTRHRKVDKLARMQALGRMRAASTRGFQQRDGHHVEYRTFCFNPPVVGSASEG
jgi:hypothetical protein